jgi:hypothetical protein
MLESPQSRWKTAWSYALTIKRLAEEEPDIHSIHSPAIYLLSGFVLELGLKAFLLGHDAEFKRDHDLKGLYAAYVGAGGAHNFELQGLIEMMAEPHKRHFWRYMPSAEEIVVPLPLHLSERLEPFLISIANQVSGGPERSKDWLEDG